MAGLLRRHDSIECLVPPQPSLQLRAKPHRWLLSQYPHTALLSLVLSFWGDDNQYHNTDFAAHRQLPA